MSEELTIEEIRERWVGDLRGWPLEIAQDDIRFLLAKLDEAGDVDICELCDKTIFEQHTFNVCGPCYNGAVRAAWAYMKAACVEKVQQLLTHAQVGKLRGVIIAELEGVEVGALAQHHGTGEKR